MATRSVAVCEHCDAVFERLALPRGAVARCLRCDAELYRNRALDIDRMLALTIAGLVVLAIANAWPIVELELQGARIAASLWGAILATWDSGIGAVAILAAATLFFFPLLQLLLLLWVLLPLRRGRRPPALVWAMQALRRMQPWSMLEVFMFGVLVSVVKLAGMATVVPGAGLWAFALLTVVLTLLAGFDRETLWERADACPA